MNYHFQGEFEDDRKHYNFDVVENGETSLLSTLNSLKKIQSNQLEIFQLEIQEEEKLLNCKNEATSLTKCFNDHFENKYPNNRVAVYQDLAFSRTNGLKFMTDYTNCTRPCKRTIYKLSEYISVPIEFMEYPQAKLLFPKDNQNKSIGKNNEKEPLDGEHLS